MELVFNQNSSVSQSLRGEARRATLILPHPNGDPMPDKRDQHLRQNLVYLIASGGAHTKFDDVLKNLPPRLRGKKPANFPHSPWMLLEHLRIAQRHSRIQPQSQAQV